LGMMMMEMDFELCRFLDFIALILGHTPLS